MSDYDFKNLNDKEFESLSVDILSYHFNTHIERFKAGKDGGVDGRFFSNENREVIIQCKHYYKSGIAKLLRDIAKTEVGKVRKLNPYRYIFVTSIKLSKGNKNKIKDLFTPYILSENDIFGNEDLNILLFKNPSIEQKYYKLWISSTNVLRIMLNQSIIGRSEFKLNQIIDESHRYVLTENHNAAIEKLTQAHSIIITGGPGIGKTYLADQICQYYTANEYQLCYIENSLNEAESVYDKEIKQIFYYDDFLGRNFLLALSHHQDSQIIHFMKRVEKDPKKRFILTSRSNVFNKGRHLSDMFENNNIDKNEYELSISSLSELDKAKILYNHMWFSDLDITYIDEIYEQKRYKSIINHKNFNPRLISFITDSHKLSGVSSENYWTYIEETLSNPQGIWRNVFEIQMDDICRHIVVAVTLHGTVISENKMKEFYRRLKSSQLNVNNNESFQSTMKLLVGALLNRHIITEQYVIYNLFNPSIADYIISSHIDDLHYLDTLLTCLNTPESITNIYSLYKSEIIEHNFCKQLFESQFEKIYNSENRYKLDTFLLKLLFNIARLGELRENILNYIKSLFEYILNYNSDEFDLDILTFLNWLMDLQIINISNPRLTSLLNTWILDDDIDFDDYVALSKLISRIDENKSKDDLIKVFKEQFIDHYSDYVTFDIVDRGIFDEEYFDSYEDDDYFPEIKIYVKERTSELYIEFDQKEINAISSCCDISEVSLLSRDSSTNEPQHLRPKDSGYNLLSSANEIEDLFDKG